MTIKAVQHHIRQTWIAF